MYTRPVLLSLTGEALRSRLPDLARLRVAVFREWPYIYDGSEDYEATYLSRYETTPGAVLVAAFASDATDAPVIGAATGNPLAQEIKAFQAPFLAHDLDPDDIYYFAESVLLPDWRGHGIGHLFFDHREAHVRALGYSHAAFCAIVRPDDHLLRDPAYRPLDPFWRKRGYAPVSGLIAHFPWRDIGEETSSAKPMQIWMRAL